VMPCSTGMSYLLLPLFQFDWNVPVFGGKCVALLEVTQAVMMGY